MKCRAVPFRPCLRSGNWSDHVSVTYESPREIASGIGVGDRQQIERAAVALVEHCGRPDGWAHEARPMDVVVKRFTERLDATTF